MLVAMKTLGEIYAEIEEARRAGLWRKRIELAREGIALTRPEDLEDWYALRLFLATFLIAEHEGGDYGERVEESIALCKEMVGAISGRDDPPKWAGIHDLLGSAYDERITGKKADNLEKVIEHSTQELSVSTREGHCEDWATTKLGLGLALSERQVGDREANLREAMRHYEEVRDWCQEHGSRKDYQNALDLIEEAYPTSSPVPGTPTDHDRSA